MNCKLHNHKVQDKRRKSLFLTLKIGEHSVERFLPLMYEVDGLREKKSDSNRLILHQLS